MKENLGSTKRRYFVVVLCDFESKLLAEATLDS